MDHPVATAGSRPFVNSLMKNYDEGSIVASLSPILDWRSVVSWSVIPIGVVWRRHGRMAALSVREPRSVCVSWRGCRRRCPFIWSPFVFTCYIGAVVINSVANPSPRESTNLPCIPRPREFVSFFTNISTRDVSRVCVSLSCARQRESVCVNFRVRTSPSTSVSPLYFFVVVVVIVLVVVVVVFFFSRAKSAVRGIVPLHNCACIALSLFYVPLCVRA